MRKTQFIFPAFLLALAIPQVLTAQTPTKTAISENASSSTVSSTANDKAPLAPTVMSFLDWKAMRVHEAQQKLEQINKPSNQAQVWQEGKSSTDPKPNEQKLNFNVEVALQLNIQDYFSMYLKTLTQEEFKEATKTLSPDEVAELLVAYKNSMEKEKKILPKFSKNPKDNAKSKNTEI